MKDSIKKLLTSSLESDNEIGFILLKRECEGYKEMFYSLQKEFRGLKYATLQTRLLDFNMLDVPFK